MTSPLNLRLPLKFMLGFALLTSQAWAQEVKVRTSISTNDNFWVGQRVPFVVELLAPGFFASAPAFDLPDPPGLLLLPPTDHPTLSSEQIDDTTYTVQHHELSAFAQRAGTYEIPPLTIRFQFKRNPLDHDSVQASVKTASLRFTVIQPPGSKDLGSIISARDLQTSETWQPEPDKTNLMVGSAFKRLVTFMAPGIPGMAFPPFPVGKIDGLAVYTNAPEVLDHSERGELTGKRTETFTYVCERAGNFVVPAVSFTSWDLDSKQLRTNNFPARRFEVAPNPALASVGMTNRVGSLTAHNFRKTRDWKRTGTSAAFILLLLIPLSIKRVRHKIANWIGSLRPVHLEPLNPSPQNQKRQPT